MNQEVSILKKICLFNGIEEEGIKDILNCLNSKGKMYKKNESVLLAGSPIPGLGILLEGKARVIREDIMGNRMIVASLETGEIFGETLACAGVQESPVYVTAVEKCDVLWIPVNRIVSPCEKACNFHTCLITNLLQLLAEKNLFLNNKMELLSRRTIREKILAYLISQGELNHSSTFHIPLNRNELADYLCIDRSAMSREMSKLKSEGFIDYDKNTFRLYKFPEI